MIITITGSMGSGKSSLARFLSKELGLKHYSIGDFMGEIAMQRGMSLMELSRLAENSRDIDETLDERLVYLDEHEDDFVIDTRLGWHFIPHSFKIFLKCGLDVGAERIFKDKRKDEKENTSVEKTRKNMERRALSERKRYREYYNIDPFDEKNFDFVLDTTNLSLDEVYKKVLDAIKSYKQKKFT